MSEADGALVIRSQAGDRAAFEQLVRNTARIIFARIYLETGDPHRAEDLVQETYLLAWRRIRQVTDPLGFRSWLFSVAHSVVVDALRRDTRKKRTAVMAPAAALGAAMSADPSPPEAAEASESRENVLAALRILPEEYRQPLMLRYIAGADYQTIGRQLGLSNGSLRGMLSRGLAMLRIELTRNSDEPHRTRQLP